MRPNVTCIGWRCVARIEATTRNPSPSFWDPCIHVSYFLLLPFYYHLVILPFFLVSPVNPFTLPCFYVLSTASFSFNLFNSFNPFFWKRYFPFFFNSIFSISFQIHSSLLSFLTSSYYFQLPSSFISLPHLFCNVYFCINCISLFILVNSSVLPLYLIVSLLFIRST